MSDTPAEYEKYYNLIMAQVSPEQRRQMGNKIKQTLEHDRILVVTNKGGGLYSVEVRGRDIICTPTDRTSPPLPVMRNVTLINQDDTFVDRTLKAGFVGLTIGIIDIMVPPVALITAAYLFLLLHFSSRVWKRHITSGRLLYCTAVTEDKEGIQHFLFSNLAGRTSGLNTLVTNPASYLVSEDTFRKATQSLTGIKNR